MRSCVRACVRVQCPPRSPCPTVERAGASGDEADVRGAVERETVAVHVIVEVGEVTAKTYFG